MKQRWFNRVKMDLRLCIFVAYFVLYNVHAKQLGTQNNREDSLRDRINKTIDLESANGKDANGNHVELNQNDRNDRSSDLGERQDANVPYSHENSLIIRQSTDVKDFSKMFQRQKRDSGEDTLKTGRFKDKLHSQKVDSKEEELGSRYDSDHNISQAWYTYLMGAYKTSFQRSNTGTGYPNYPQFNPWSDYLPGYSYAWS